MPAINLNIDEKDINETLTKAILDSTIGDAVRKQVEESIKSMGGWNTNPVKDYVQLAIRKVVADYVNEHKEAIHQSIVAQFTAENLHPIVEKFLKNLSIREY